MLSSSGYLLHFTAEVTTIHERLFYMKNVYIEYCIKIPTNVEII